MTSYLALLRGINVGGHRKISMAELRQLVSGLGHTGVSTYLQSGNVLLHSDESPDMVAATMREALAAQLGFDVDVLMRTRAQMARIVGANPYLGQEQDFTKLHVTFLAGTPVRGHADMDADLDADLQVHTHADMSVTTPITTPIAVPIPAGETGVLTVDGHEVFLHCPAGYGRTKLTNAFIERTLGVPATTRNWRSVVALHDLLAA